MEEIARADAAHSVILSVNNSLVCEPIVKYGTDEQKNDYLRGSPAATCSARSA